MGALGLNLGVGEGGERYGGKHGVVWAGSGHGLGSLRDHLHLHTSHREHVTQGTRHTGNTSHRVPPPFQCYRAQCGLVIVKLPVWSVLTPYWMIQDLECLGSYRAPYSQWTIICYYGYSHQAFT